MIELGDREQPHQCYLERQGSCRQQKKSPINPGSGQRSVIKDCRGCQILSFEAGTSICLNYNYVILFMLSLKKEY